MDKLTLGELLTHDNEEVRRHAMGCQKALRKYVARVIAEQDKRMPNYNHKDGCTCPDCSSI